MGADGGRIPQIGPAETAVLEERLQAILMQLDASGQSLAAAYVALAINVLVPDPLDASMFAQFKTPPDPLSGTK